MHKSELHTKLDSLHLDTRGNKEVLKKRLKNYYKKLKLSKAKVSCCKNSTKHYDYFCVIDFEATCEQNHFSDYKHEIIEFPAVLVDTRTLETVDEFHEYCRPQVHPKLSSFCTELTGITQSQVDGALLFHEVLKKFEAWLEKNKLGTDHAFAVVTDGPWDMGRFLNIQCQLSQLRFPRYAKKWVNIRKTYSNFYQCKRMSLQNMLELLGLTFVGRPHCGIDDARNITQILLHLIKDGAEIRVNERIDRHGCHDVANVPQKTFSHQQSSNDSASKEEDGESSDTSENDDNDAEPVDSSQLEDFSLFVGK